MAPSKIGGYRPKAISGDHRVWLLQRIKRDFTLRGLVAELAERGLKVDYRSVWEFVHAEKLSFKKKRGGWRTAPPPWLGGLHPSKRVCAKHGPMTSSAIQRQ